MQLSIGSYSNYCDSSYVGVLSRFTFLFTNKSSVKVPQDTRPDSCGHTKDTPVAPQPSGSYRRRPAVPEPRRGVQKWEGLPVESVPTSSVLFPAGLVGSEKPGDECTTTDFRVPGSLQRTDWLSVSSSFDVSLSRFQNLCPSPLLTPVKTLDGVSHGFRFEFFSCLTTRPSLLTLFR